MGTCQENYMDYFSEINDFVEFIPWDTTKVCSILSNTFLNNWSRKQNEHRRSKNNDMVKRAKLSVQCMVFSYLIGLFVDFISRKVAIMTVFAGMTPPPQGHETPKEDSNFQRNQHSRYENCFSMPITHSFRYPSQNAGPCTAFMLKNANFAGLTPLFGP